MFGYYMHLLWFIILPGQQQHLEDNVDSQCISCFMFCVCVCVFLLKNFIKHHAFLAIMFHVFKFLFPLNTMHLSPSCFVFFVFPLSTMHLWSSCFMIFIYLFIPSFECHAFVIFMFHVIYFFLSSFEHHAFDLLRKNFVKHVFFQQKKSLWQFF